MHGEQDLPDIRYAPTDGLSYNPNEPLYWDAAALDKEILRAFELCHGCRMCFKYCPSFPTLFKAVDEHGDVRRLPAAVRRQVVDECFQCKLCYTQCPYTDAEGHAFRLDFPRLMLRAKAIRRRAEGVPLRERLLGDPDRLGRVATRFPALANWANRSRLNRVLMEKLGGIHRRKQLPAFESPTFAEWAARQAPVDGRHPVVLFATCFVNYNKPAVGRAAFSVLQHNDCRVSCPELNCCGMPALDGGDIALAKRKAERNVRVLAPLVEQGHRIAVIDPTCSLMMKQEYPELLDDPADPALHEAAKKVAAATRDFGEYLYELRSEGLFKTDFRSTPGGPVAYHAPCHLRMQKVGFRSRDLMRMIPGTQPKLVAECCGHDGTWAMKVEWFEKSLDIGRKAFEGMAEAGAQLWTSDCPLASIQFEQACGRTVLHPIEVLERAYREDGFPQKVGEPAAAGSDRK
ncbi:MAG: hypothetical protein KBD01_11465 [Acidobacteria bacterium]|nr:hypothetical protein [Acidobacteriota bacterium]